MSDVVVWSGTMAGIYIGLYGLLQLYLTGKPLGCSTSYGNACAALSDHNYFSTKDFAKANNWRLWFILGIVPGGYISVLSSSGFEGFHMSWQMGAMYDAMMPENEALKTLLLFMGGVLCGVGARMANGCTSGHAISGIAFLNVTSIVLALVIMLSAMVMGNMLFYQVSPFFGH